MPDSHGSDKQSAAAPDMAPGRPVGTGNRLVSLDFIRGLAVLGILLANITAFAHPMLAYHWPSALPDGGTAGDRIVWLAQLVLVDGKFRGLFTILFGAGMYLFMERAWARGEGLGLQLRRLFFLLIFGIAHSVLLFAGDILVLYALGGFLALPLVECSARRQLALGAVGCVAGGVLTMLAFSSAMMIEQWPDVLAQAAPETLASLDAQAQARIDAGEADMAVMTGGSYADIVRYRLAKEANEAGYLVWLALTETVPLMLLGMGLYRVGLFFGGLDTARVRLWASLSLATGLLATLALGLWPYLQGFPPFLTIFAANGAAALTSLPTIIGLTLLLGIYGAHAAAGWLGERLVAAGRMAFSNYVGTSLLMMLVFQGWAGGLFGQLHRIELLLPVVLAWAVMLAWSKPWLAVFRYGPLEWLWRCLTYGRVFAIRH